ncbi:hypothetical protein AC249_AIPGENE6463 [Exaiptasia diaphana]|nr:hypothetical protein AC249_AIPGENE6463 [Exaiptasia diaphana]
MIRSPTTARAPAGLSSQKITRFKVYRPEVWLVKVPQASSTPAVLSREHMNIQALMKTIDAFTNPFKDESPDLFNIVTKVVMPDGIKKDLCDQSIIGQTFFDAFVKDRIQTGDVNLWSKMKKRKT